MLDFHLLLEGILLFLKRLLTGQNGLQIRSNQVLNHLPQSGNYVAHTAILQLKATSRKRPFEAMRVSRRIGELVYIELTSLLQVGDCLFDGTALADDADFRTFGHVPGIFLMHHGGVGLHLHRFVRLKYTATTKGGDVRPALCCCTSRVSLWLKLL